MKNYIYIGIPLSIIILIVIIFFLCFGNTKKEMFTIDYCGEKEFYEGAKDSYPAGTEIKLYYNLIATDTDYTFYLDDEYLKCEYDNKKGFVIRFIMPAHNVKQECITKNSMTYEF